MDWQKGGSSTNGGRACLIFLMSWVQNRHIVSKSVFSPPPFLALSPFVACTTLIKSRPFWPPLTFIKQVDFFWYSHLLMTKPKHLLLSVGSYFVICVEVIIYLLLYNMRDCTFNIKLPLHSFIFSWFIH